MSKQLDAFVEGIRKCGLLGPEQVDQVAAWAAAPHADPQAIARDIVQRGWLSAFQVKAIWKGKGSELFLNQYVLLDRLGEGGMGEVFRAKHRRMDRIVALKIIRKERLNSVDAVKRFQREIQAAAHLAHENVVMAYDADQSGDRHFFAMEYVDGTNLARLVRDKGPLPVHQACDCIRQAALGLEHAFERGMVHRDIKPSNLLLSKTGVVKILDMGLARVREADADQVESRITQEGFVIGTPDYLAPEQARNARNCDIRADIYALGCTFYFLLVGNPPYKGETPTEKMVRHTTDSIPPIPRPDVLPPVEAIVQKMMAKRPEDRFQTPAEIALALQPYCGIVPPIVTSLPTPAPVPAVPAASARHARPVAPPTPPPVEPEIDPTFRVPSSARRRQAKPERTRWNLPVAISAGVIALLLAAGGIYLLVKKSPSGPPPNAAPNLDKEFTNRFEMNFTLIGGGTFEMGSAENEDEGPVHSVEITKPFYLGTTEVTLGQFKAVMGRSPKAFKGNDDDVDLPATSVTFVEAQAFCRNLNADKGKKEGWEYRLPTEAEWEYACRAGTTTRFHGGDDLTREQALFGDGSLKAPGKVGRFAANAWGLFDMHGNVAEWVNDKYDEKYYANSPAKDPYGGSARKARNVIRGGGYNDPKEACRSAKRRAEYGDDFVSFANVGFRVAIVQVQKKD